MKNYGWRETGGNAPESVRKRRERIESCAKTLGYELDSIQDDIFEDVLRQVIYRTPKPSWFKALCRVILHIKAEE